MHRHAITHFVKTPVETNEIFKLKFENNRKKVKL